MPGKVSSFNPRNTQDKMTSAKTLLKTILYVNSAVVEDIRLQEDSSGGMSIHLDVRPRLRSSRRCPVCGRACPRYDRGSIPERLS